MERRSVVRVLRDVRLLLPIACARLGSGAVVLVRGGVWAVGAAAAVGRGRCYGPRSIYVKVLSRRTIFGASFAKPSSGDRLPSFNRENGR